MEMLKRYMELKQELKNVTQTFNNINRMLIDPEATETDIESMFIVLAMEADRLAWIANGKR